MCGGRNWPHHPSCMQLWIIEQKCSSGFATSSDARAIQWLIVQRVYAWASDIYVTHLSPFPLAQGAWTRERESEGAPREPPGCKSRLKSPQLHAGLLKRDQTLTRSESGSARLQKNRRVRMRAEQRGRGGGGGVKKIQGQRKRQRTKSRSTVRLAFVLLAKRACWTLCTRPPFTILTLFLFCQRF